MICEEYLFAVCELWLVVNCWIQIEQKREIDRLIWIEQLILKAKALDFVEVEGHFFREYLIDGYASHRSIRSIEHFIE